MARETTYVTPSVLWWLRGLVTVLGVAGAVAGPVYAINGATQAGAAVRVPVELAVGTVDVPGLPDGALVTGQDGGRAAELSAWYSTVGEQLLARGDAAVLGLAAGVAAWLLRPVLASIAAGHPFEPGNARRLAGLAVLVVLAGGIGPLLPQLASLAVLDRLGQAGPGGAFVPGVTLTVVPALLAGVLLLVLAEVFRQGEGTSWDVEELV
ncbi:DUF2975 domain-containing protein [uncultured Modestobacter sp.]|uniref:DUF2975 domain-containing protein n=1 Tax=uncultured Modestobacter sp. TaxID=380048 RepID=UPI0026383928|nr:DUF2975 domain-containing protein [uncultured Modestobacter sp.]